MAGPEASQVRRASADAVVFNDPGHILCQRRTDNGMWCLPGGSVEIGEATAASVAREVRGEAGLIVEAVKLIGLYSDPVATTHRYPSGDVVHYVSALFECRIIGGELKRNPDESLSVGFFDCGDLPQPFMSDHLPRVKDAVARRTEAFFR